MSTGQAGRRDYRRMSTPPQPELEPDVESRRMSSPLQPPLVLCPATPSLDDSEVLEFRHRMQEQLDLQNAVEPSYAGTWDEPEEVVTDVRSAYRQQWQLQQQRRQQQLMQTQPPVEASERHFDYYDEEHADYAEAFKLNEDFDLGDELLARVAQGPFKYSDFREMIKSTQAMKSMPAVIENKVLCSRLLASWGVPIMPKWVCSVASEGNPDIVKADIVNAAHQMWNSPDLCVDGIVLKAANGTGNEGVVAITRQCFKDLWNYESLIGTAIALNERAPRGPTPGHFMPMRSPRGVVMEVMMPGRFLEIRCYVVHNLTFYLLDANVISL